MSILFGGSVLHIITEYFSVIKIILPLKKYIKTGKKLYTSSLVTVFISVIYHRDYLLKLKLLHNN